MYDAHGTDYDHEIGSWYQKQEQDDTECASASGKKRKTDDASSKPPSKRQAIRDEVDEIYADLQDKHGSTYTAAQLRLWANMMRLVHTRTMTHLPKCPCLDLIPNHQRIRNKSFGWCC